MNEDDLWRFSDGHFFPSPFLLALLSFSFLLVIMLFFLCNIERVGLDLVGGVRWDLRVQSYHVFYLIVSLRFTVVSVFKLFFFFMRSVPSDQPVVCHTFFLFFFFFIYMCMTGWWLVLGTSSLKSHSETISLAASFFQLLTWRQCWSDEKYFKLVRAHLFIFSLSLYREWLYCIRSMAGCQIITRGILYI